MALRSEDSPWCARRQVAMVVLGKQFMLAKSTVYLTRPDWIACIESEGVEDGDHGQAAQDEA